MGIAIALGLFGIFIGAVVRNRTGAVLAAAAAALAVFIVVPSLDPYLTNSATGRRLGEFLHHNGSEHLSMIRLFACAAAGVLVAWLFVGRSSEHRPDWEWDPDHPRRRKQRRRRMWVGG